MITKAAPRRGEVPASYAAEQALIGCVLLDEWQVWGELEEAPIEADDFLAPEHQAIWRAFRYMQDKGQPISWVTTSVALSTMGVIDAVDSWLGEPSTEAYLASLEASTWSAAGCGYLARIIKSFSDQRSAPVAARMVINL